MGQFEIERMASAISRPTHQQNRQHRQDQHDDPDEQQRIPERRALLDGITLRQEPADSLQGSSKDNHEVTRVPLEKSQDQALGRSEVERAPGSWNRSEDRVGLRDRSGRPLLDLAGERELVEGGTAQIGRAENVDRPGDIGLTIRPDAAAGTIGNRELIPACGLGLGTRRRTRAPDGRRSGSAAPRGPRRRRSPGASSRRSR